MVIIKSLVIIPTYNESENIIDLINEIFLLDDNLHILVVDDNSQDKTSDLVEEKIKLKLSHLLFFLSTFAPSCLTASMVL